MLSVKTYNSWVDGDKLQIKLPFESWCKNHRDKQKGGHTFLECIQVY